VTAGRSAFDRYTHNIRDQARNAGLREARLFRPGELCAKEGQEWMEIVEFML
jgi:hypothetical protein